MKEFGEHEIRKCMKLKDYMVVKKKDFERDSENLMLGMRGMNLNLNMGRADPHSATALDRQEESKEAKQSKDAQHTLEKKKQSHDSSEQYLEQIDFDQTQDYNKPYPDLLDDF